MAYQTLPGCTYLLIWKAVVTFRKGLNNDVHILHVTAIFIPTEAHRNHVTKNDGTCDYGTNVKAWNRRVARLLVGVASLFIISLVAFNSQLGGFFVGTLNVLPNMEQGEYALSAFVGVSPWNLIATDVKLQRDW